MTRQPRARKIPAPPKTGGWASFYRRLNEQQRRSAAEGQCRPAPPATTTDPEQTEDTDGD